MTLLRERARAKINLSLHIVRRRADSWHDLESLVAFAGVSDVLTLAHGATLSLTLAGAHAQGAGAGDDNLVLRAARQLKALVPGLHTGAFHLVKNLPVAAGIGGGSSDAAAALRLLARANGLTLDDPRLIEAARVLGADVSVCLDQRARMMRGAGESLGPPLALPLLFVVLVNPGLGLATKNVFARMGLKAGEETGFGPHPAIASGMDASGLITALKKARNDMEDAAIVEAPVISAVLNVIAAARGCRIARMSGSGATCFGLFETRHAALRAAQVIRRGHPGWWVRASVLR